jgi:hypothetical protein
MKKSTRIVVADERCARILAGIQPDRGLIELSSFIDPLARPRRPLWEFDAQGSLFNQAAHQTPRTVVLNDLQIRRAAGFATLIAHRLLESFKQGDFDSLVLAAPRHFMGLLRQALGPALLPVVELQCEEDWVSLDAQEIGARLASEQEDADDHHRF